MRQKQARSRGSTHSTKQTISAQCGHSAVAPSKAQAHNENTTSAIQVSLTANLQT